MGLTQRIAWTVGATLLCATSVLAASTLLGFSLRPGYADAALPPTAETIPAPVAALLPPAAALLAEPAAPEPRFEVASLAPAPGTPVAWLRPALSEDDFSARFDAPTPGLAFATLAATALDLGTAAPASAASGGVADGSPAFSRLLDVRPPARPAFPRRRLASLDPEAALPVEPEATEPAAVAASPAPGFEPTSPRILDSWTDPFNRRGTAPQQPSAGGRALSAGIASWYGPGFHGRRTASGEVFNQNAMTAAHRHLPFGTRVRVVDERTGRSVVVRINDRGPFKPGRVIDLSKNAAQELGMGGLARVKVVSADE